jgi:hypothetical protein
MNAHDLQQWLKHLWRPHPIKAPTVDREFSHLDGFTRAIESWRYTILCLEHWLCPSGALREFIRHILRLAVILLLPAFIIIPIISFVLGEFVKWMVMLTTIAWKIIILPILALIGMVVSMISWMVFKAFVSAK